MQVYEDAIWQDNMPFLAQDSYNPPVTLNFVTDEVLRDKFPHQVMIEAYLCTGPKLYEKRRFCDILGFDLCRKIGSVRTNDVLYRVFAFADNRHARTFASRFGGVRYVMGRVATAD